MSFVPLAPAILSSALLGGGGSAYVPTPVTANGSQSLAWTGGASGLFSSDSASIIMFASSVPAAGSNRRIMSWGDNDFSGYFKTAATQWNLKHDAGAKNHTATVSPAAGVLQHHLFTCKPSDPSGDLIIQSAVWDATNGLQTKQETLSGATTLSLNTSGGVVTLLTGAGGSFQAFVGDLNRIYVKVGATGDVTDAAFRELFFDEETLIDPIAATGTLGAATFDAVGNAAAWNGGFGGVFTKTGDAFTNA